MLMVAIIVEIGSVLLGVAAMLTAAGGLLASRRAQRRAEEAMRVSPAGLLEGLRSEVQEVLDSYVEAAQRWQSDRTGMEDALRRERERADGAELSVVQLRSELATIRIDFAASRVEVAELRRRVEAMLSSQSAHHSK